MKSSRNSRREWLSGLLRWGALSALAAVAALLMRRSASSSSGRCVRREPCARCGSLAKCQLPRAVAWKRS